MKNTGILIIDDDSVLRKTLADVLRLKGFENITAGNGTEGLALLEETAVNLVLIDLGLPDIPGIELLERIKSVHPDIEAIILTGNASLDSAIEATNKGAFSYLLKPYDIEQLLLHIRRASEKQRVETEITRHNIELERMNLELQALHDVSLAINRTLDLDELVKEILHFLVQTDIFPFKMHGAIYLVENENVRLACVSGPSITPCKEVFPGQCRCGQAVVTGEVAISRNIPEDGRQFLCGADSQGRIIAPLKAAGKVVGVLSLYTRSDVDVSNNLLKLLTALGNQIGMALNNARLYQQTKSISLHDPLTGLPNRRFLEIQMEKCLVAANRYGEQLSIIMLDIDHFKKFNDTYGHVEGDRLLARLGGILSRDMRGADYAFRYGGEEFLILLPETDLFMGGEAAERLRKEIELEAGVTVSLGVAAFGTSLQNMETLISSADAALYLAKKHGRNRVELSSQQAMPEQTGLIQKSAKNPASDFFY